MKKRIVPTILTVLLIACLVPTPLAAVNKETLQLLQQVSMIQQQLRDLQDSQIKSNAIIQKLTEQILDQVTRLSASVDDLKKSNAQTQAAIGNKVDSFVGNQQIVQENLDELKARLNKLATDLASIKSSVESIDAKIAASAPSGTSGAPGESTTVPLGGQTTAKPSQSPDNLYATALSDYTSGRYKLALGEFQQYLQYYGDTPLAGNAQFYIGQVYYDQGQFQSAIAAYNVVVERFPESNKLTQAIYKKGLALEKLEQRTAASKEFRMLVSRYPNSPEAKLAAQELAKLNPRSARAASSRTSRRK